MLLFFIFDYVFPELAPPEGKSKDSLLQIVCRDGRVISICADSADDALWGNFSIVIYNGWIFLTLTRWILSQGLDHGTSGRQTQRCELHKHSLRGKNTSTVNISSSAASGADHRRICWQDLVCFVGCAASSGRFCRGRRSISSSTLFWIKHNSTGNTFKGKWLWQMLITTKNNILFVLGYPAYVVACVLKLVLNVDFVISVWSKLVWPGRTVKGRITFRSNAWKYIGCYKKTVISPKKTLLQMILSVLATSSDENRTLM